MCTRGLPDIYTLSPRASGVYIRQTTRAHGVGNCNKYSEMSEVPATVTRMPMDTIILYCHDVALIYLTRTYYIIHYYYLTLYILLRHSSVTITTVLDILRGGTDGLDPLCHSTFGSLCRLTLRLLGCQSIISCTWITLWIIIGGCF